MGCQAFIQQILVKCIHLRPGSQAQAHKQCLQNFLSWIFKFFHCHKIVVLSYFGQSTRQSARLRTACTKIEIRFVDSTGIAE